MRVFVNGQPIEAEENAEIVVTNEPESTDAVAKANDATVSTGVKETRLSRAKNWMKAHPWKTAGIIAGGAALIGRVFGQTAFDEDDEEETETEPEEEETEEE